MAQDGRTYPPVLSEPFVDDVYLSNLMEEAASAWNEHVDAQEKWTTAKEAVRSELGNGDLGDALAYIHDRARERRDAGGRVGGG